MIKNMPLVMPFLTLILTACLLCSCHRHSRAPQYPPWCLLAGDADIACNLNYGNGSPEPAHCLDLVVPRGLPGPFPLVVWIHGGAWLSGDKWDCPGAMLVRMGYAVASINYRLSPEARFPAQLDDCKAAVRFLRVHARKYNIDPERIGVWGNSAGGHLVAMLGTTCGVKHLEGQTGNEDISSSVQAVCDWCGPSDLLSIADQCGAHWGLDFKSPDAPQYRLIGGKYGNWKERLIAASPVAYIRKDNPPFLIFHGGQDNVVPIAQSQELLAALRKAGVDVRLIIVPGAGHSFGSPSEFEAVLNFFNDKLKRPAKVS